MARLREATMTMCLFLFLTTQVFSQELVHSKQNVGSDEDYEEYNGEGIICLADEFKCDTVEQCVLKLHRCNGVPFECRDNSDELNCTFPATTSPQETTTEEYYYQTDPCSDTQFECDGQICIEKSEQCDGKRDCPSGNDEMDCATMPSVTVSTFPAYGSCDDNDFDCGDGACISREVHCDGIYDCADGRDEIDCTVSINSTITQSTTTTSITSTTEAEYDGCDEEKEFECNEGCLPISLRCDGVFDCSDSSDEDGCIDENETTQAEQISTSASMTSARPFTEKPTCLYNDVFYPADAQILKTNCTEISCSSSGNILTWDNDDPSCSGFTVKPTATVSSTTAPSTISPNKTAWVKAYNSWRNELFNVWLPALREYSKTTFTGPSSFDCQSWPRASCHDQVPLCVLDTQYCVYCYCEVTETDSSATLEAAWERDFAFWKDVMESEWKQTFAEYKSSGF